MEYVYTRIFETLICFLCFYETAFVSVPLPMFAQLGYTQTMFNSVYSSVHPTSYMRNQGSAHSQECAQQECAHPGDAQPRHAHNLVAHNIYIYIYMYMFIYVL